MCLNAGVDFDQYIGLPTTSANLVVERAPVTAFAAAITDRNAVYRNAAAATAAGFDGIPAPPTYGFIAQNWGRWEELQPPAPGDGRNPMAEVMGGLMANGGLVLHGEQEFRYHRPVVSGDELHVEGVVTDIYQKVSGDRTMTFMVIEDTYTDASGEPVLTSIMNLIHRS
jgi:acyl dehydratase